MLEGVYEDKEWYEFFGIRYQATSAEANDLLLAMMDLKEWKEYKTLSLVLESVRINSKTFFLETKDMCARMVELDVVICNKAHQYIKNVIQCL